MNGRAGSPIDIDMAEINCLWSWEMVWTWGLGELESPAEMQARPEAGASQSLRLLIPKQLKPCWDCRVKVRSELSRSRLRRLPARPEHSWPVNNAKRAGPIRSCGTGSNGTGSNGSAGHRGGRDHVPGAWPGRIGMDSQSRGGAQFSAQSCARSSEECSPQSCD